MYVSCGSGVIQGRVEAIAIRLEAIRNKQRLKIDDMSRLRGQWLLQAWQVVLDMIPIFRAKAGAMLWHPTSE